MQIKDWALVCKSQASRESSGADCRAVGLHPIIDLDHPSSLPNTPSQDPLPSWCWSLACPKFVYEAKKSAKGWTTLEKPHPPRFKPSPHYEDTGHSKVGKRISFCSEAVKLRKQIATSGRPWNRDSPGLSFHRHDPAVRASGRLAERRWDA